MSIWTSGKLKCERTSKSWISGAPQMDRDFPEGTLIHAGRILRQLGPRFLDDLTAFVEYDNLLISVNHALS